MLPDLKVPLPSTRLNRKTKKNGTTYIYHVVKSYRNEKGIPTTDEFLIGKLDESKQFLIPNKNYFEIFGNDYLDSNHDNKNIHDIEENNMVDYGQIHILRTLSSQEGISYLLKALFPNFWREILTIAIYMATNTLAKRGVLEWYNKYQPSFVNTITDNLCVDIFSKITFDDRMDFLENWRRVNPDFRLFAYSTNFSLPNTKDISILEFFTMFKDFNLLDQLVIFGQKDKLPIFYTENQKDTDESNLTNILSLIDDFYPAYIELILATRPVSVTDIKSTLEKDCNFILPLPLSNQYTKKIIDLVKNDIEQNKYWLSSHKIFGREISYTLYNTPVKAYIFFDPLVKNIERINFYMLIDELESKINNFNSIEKKIYYKYFNLIEREISTKNEIKNRRNFDNIASTEEYFGFNVYITKSNHYSLSDVMDLYSTRDGIESYFKCHRDYWDDPRLKTPDELVKDGKIFVGFIGLILISLFSNYLKKHKETSNFSTLDALDKLSNFEIECLHGNFTTEIPNNKDEQGIYNSLGSLVYEILLLQDQNTLL
jgi:hypothetical protein